MPKKRESIDYLSPYDDLTPFIPQHRKATQRNYGVYVCLGIVFVAWVITGLLAFAALPRQIVTFSDAYQHVRRPNRVTLENFPDAPDKYRLNVSFVEAIYIRNDNYYPIEVTRIELHASHTRQQPGGSSFLITYLSSYDKLAPSGRTVPLRGGKMLSADFVAVFDTRRDSADDGVNSYFIQQYIKDPPNQAFVTIDINATIHLSALGNVQHQTHHYSLRLGCTPYYTQVIDNSY